LIGIAIEEVGRCVLGEVVLLVDAVEEDGRQPIKKWTVLTVLEDHGWRSGTLYVHILAKAACKLAVFRRGGMDMMVILDDGGAIAEVRPPHHDTELLHSRLGPICFTDRIGSTQTLLCWRFETARASRK
jgi:hypothetical protein